MPSCVVTDNRTAAQAKYPNDKIVCHISDVLMLADGTAVKIFETRIGRQIEGPCQVARVLIGQAKLIEVVEDL